MDTGFIVAMAVGIPISLIIGGLVGYFVAMKIFKKQLKKNPPITEAQIKAMYAQMGRTPSQGQIKRVMSKMKGQDDK